MACRKNGLTLAEIEEIVNDEEFQDSVDDDESGHIDIVELPPEITNCCFR